MATYATPIPGVPQYGQAALAAKTAYQNALARLNQQRGSTLRQAGFRGDINAETGVVENVRVDGGNTYGQYQQLNRSQAMRDEASRWAGIERGLGSGGGLAAQLRSNVRHDFGREDADLGQSLIGALSGYQDQQNQAAYDRDAALYRAELEAARMATQNEMYNPGDFGGLDYPEYAEDPLTAPTPSTVKKSAVAKVRAKPKKPAYSPYAYVPGGSSAAKAKAIQARGKAAKKKGGR